MKLLIPFTVLGSAGVLSLQMAGLMPVPANTAHKNVSHVRVSESTEKRQNSGDTAKQNEVLTENITALKKGIAFLSEKSGYTSTFRMQESLNGDLKDPQEIDLRVRNEPFGAYLKWRSSKKEVLFPSEAGSGKLRVHYNGIKGLLGDVTLNPDSALARTEGRHPVTDIGILNLAKLLLEYRERDLSQPGVKLTRAPGESIGDRPCDCYIAEYADTSVEPTFRKAVYHIDRELSIPLSFRGYGWAEDENAGDEAALLERYEYHDVEFANFSDTDFDYRNEAYSFKP